MTTAAARIGFGVRATLVSAAAVVGSTCFGTGLAHAAPAPVLAGHELRTTVPGFAPGAVVERRIDNVVQPGESRADRTGAVKVRLSAPTVLGRHRLVLVGPARPAGVASAEEESSPPLAGDPQAILVTVPRLVTIDFRVVPSLGVDAVDRNRERPHGGSGTAGESAVADTGSDLSVPLLLGGALVVLGAVVATLGRRRAQL